mmetsp:Transcript_25809/g.38647  ORF Transcript_25809/g.38647 Transcript_25809/m.38647 type:complete len:202 (+) Transcript_25809:220-825(+)
MWQWELNIPLGKLHTVHPLQILGLEGSRPNNLNRTWPSPVPTRHLIVELRNSPSELKITVLAVHVMRPRAGGVTEPNTIVFDNACVLLDDFDTVEDFASGLFHLAELVHVVPEFGFGDYGVGCEDDHAVCFGVGVFVGSGFTADYLILTHFACYSHFWGITCFLSLLMMLTLSAAIGYLSSLNHFRSTLLACLHAVHKVLS